MFILYYKPTCPFCQRVLQMAENLKIELELKDVSEDQAAADELIEKGGKMQVPFLVDTDADVSMYESNDIIDYIRENGKKADGESAKPRMHISDSTCVSCEG